MITRSIYVYNAFLRPLTNTDISINIVNTSDIIQYIIDPHSINDFFVKNNLIIIEIKDNEDIILDFSNPLESQMALSLLYNRLNILKSKGTLSVDKTISVYNVGITQSVYKKSFIPNFIQPQYPDNPCCGD